MRPKPRTGTSWAPAACACALVLGGCGSDSSDAPRPIEHYGVLPGLAATPDQDLREEYARIVEEGSTPEILQASAIAEAENVAAGLRDLFPPDKVETLLDEATSITPPARLGFAFGPVRLRRAIAFRERFDAEWQQARAALARPRCDFGIRHTAGQLADLRFIDTCWLVLRLASFYAAERLDEADLDGAIEGLGSMLRLAQCLAAEKHIVPRGEAAFMRSEALLLLEAITRHPKIEREHLATMLRMVQGQLATWPHDAEAWIGDRALGMHTYEIVRDGRMHELLKPEDVENLGGRVAAQNLAETAQRTVNADELYYLRTMRQVIEACAKPYYQRATLLQGIRTELQNREGTSAEPIVAGRLLLPGLENAQEIQARDRAFCEAWALALAHGVGLDPPPYEVNPLTGADYRVTRRDGRVEVSEVGTGLKGDDPRMIVPDLAAEAGSPAP